jgi:hypothetical protein
MHVTADKTFLQKQRNILRLLYGIMQPNLFKDQMEEGMNYNPKENIDKYQVRTATFCTSIFLSLMCIFLQYNLLYKYFNETRVYDRHKTG